MPGALTVCNADYEEDKLKWMKDQLRELVYLLR